MTAGAPPPTSLIIVSRGRPEHLARALLGVSQLDHANFELIVVADAAGLAAAEGFPAKLVAFERANISAARNAGLAVAAGEVVAFLDDDAVPEPTWLTRLSAPFANPAVAAAGGFVRGPDGLRFQWQASTADMFGAVTALPVDPVAVSLHAARPGRALRTEGTNCAFRRDVLARIGGFDPAFRYFLDETDVNMRLAAAGLATAVVPLAQVHHGLAAGPQRRGTRVPLDLHEIGASSAVFWRKHALSGVDRAGVDAARARLRAGQRARLLRLMLAGFIEPRDVAALLATLEAGLRDGATRPLQALPALPAAAAGFQRFPATQRPGRLFAGRPWQVRRLRAAAAQAVAGGAVATLLLFGPTFRRHRLQFTAAGVWVQRGGLWGAADPGCRSPRPARFATRQAHEAARLAALRPIS